MRSPDLLNHFGATGRATFTTEEATSALSKSPIAVAAGLRRLRQKGDIVSPRHGFHVIVPAEYRSMGARPAAQFVPELMAWMDRPYYAALLSAAALHGAAHQSPQVFQVMTDHALAPVEVGRVRVEFMGRKNIADIPVVERNTPTGTLRVATAEATAVDLVGYVDRCAGIDHVATVLAELCDVLCGNGLVAAARLSPMTWAQRLGYLLEFVGRPDLAEPLAAFVEADAPPFTELWPAAPAIGVPRSARWRIAINAHVEPDEL